MTEELAASKRLRIVIDPTVLIGALLEPRGDCARLLDHVAQHDLDLVLDQVVRASLEAALTDAEARDVGRWSMADAQRWINALEILAVEPELRSHQESASASQPDCEVVGADQSYFDLAAQAKALVVSTDSDTLRQTGAMGVDVVKPQTVNDLMQAWRGSV